MFYNDDLLSKSGFFFFFQLYKISLKANGMEANFGSENIRISHDAIGRTVHNCLSKMI